MKKRKIMYAALAAMLLTSCATQNTAIDDLRALSQDIQMRGDTYTINDWKNAGEKYYKINKKIAKHAGEYTDAQAQEISELNGKCVRSFSEGAVTKVQGAVNMVKSFISGFLK